MAKTVLNPEATKRRLQGSVLDKRVRANIYLPRCGQVFWSRLVLGVISLFCLGADLYLTHAQSPPSGARRELYSNVGGSSVDDLTSAAKFPNAPDAVDVIGSLESRFGFNLNYGQRLSGILVAPETGNFVFYIASDDNSQLFLSTDESAANKRLIATDPEWSESRDYLGTDRRGSPPQNRSGPIALVAGQRYYLEVLHKQGTFGEHVAVAWKKPSDSSDPANGSAPIPSSNFQGGIRREVFRNIAGGSVNDLLSSAAFPNSPDVVDNLNALESTIGEPQDYGQRLTAFLVPPVSGNYIFYIASDDNSRLYLSTDEGVVNKRLIAADPEWSESRDYLGTDRRGTPPQNRSGAISLLAGQRYYLEVLHKQGGFSQHVAVSWQKPGDSPPANGSDPIPGSHLQVFQVNQPPTLNALPNPAPIAEDSGVQQISLTGLSPGPTGGAVDERWQTLVITASSDNPNLIPNPTVTHTNPNSSAMLTYSPNPFRHGTATITVVVTDNGGVANGGANSVSRQFVVQVLDINHEPKLNPLEDYTIDETTELSFRAVASDVDGDSLKFSLDSTAPEGAVIDAASGIFRWTPSEAHGPGVFNMTVRVTDSARYHAARTFQVRVREQNSAPSLATIANQIVLEEHPLLLSVEAVDRDLPPNPLVFRLAPGSPAGATIDPMTGLFSWTPTSAQGPNTYSIGIQAADALQPQLLAQTTFSVTVNEINHAPAIASLPAQKGETGKLLEIALVAGDIDLPPQQLKWSLGTGAPAGMGIDPSTGLVRWTPSSAGTFRFLAQVSDSGTPSLSASHTVVIDVAPSASSLSDAPTISPKADLIEQARSTLYLQHRDGTFGIWRMTANKLSTAALLEPARASEAGWRIAGIGDFNGDDFPDLLLAHETGAIAVWFMNGLSLQTAAWLNPQRLNDANWRIAAVGDINGDRRPDLVLQHANGGLAVWLMDGVNLADVRFLTPSQPGNAGWYLRAMGDFDGDQQSDLIFQHEDGTVAAWLMHGTSMRSATVIQPASFAPQMRDIRAVSDLNRDSHPDLVIEEFGILSVWLMDGIRIKQTTPIDPPTPGLGWKIVGP